MTKDIIVIPDLHGRTFWKEAVEKYPDADTIFLGDYLDPYPDEGIRHKAARENFNEVLEYARTHSNVTLLFGNHDLVYWFPYNWGRKDTGWEDELLQQFRDNIALFHMFATREVNGRRWLFSHAPLFEEWIAYTEMPHELQEIEDRIWKMLDDYNRLREDEDVPRSWEERRNAHDVVWKTLGRASKLRGGIDKCGAPVWADVREIADGCELYRDTDYHVFGHTQQNRPIITDRFACLDTHQAYRITPEGQIEAITEKSTPALPADQDFSGMFLNSPEK